MSILQREQGAASCCHALGMPACIPSHNPNLMTCLQVPSLYAWVHLVTSSLANVLVSQVPQTPVSTGHVPIASITAASCSLSGNRGYIRNPEVSLGNTILLRENTNVFRVKTKVVKYYFSSHLSYHVHHVQGLHR